MKVLVSPAKKLDFETETPIDYTTEPKLLQKANKLAVHMKSLSAAELAKLMKLSQNLAQLNFERFQTYRPKANTTLAKAAVFAFNGDTYTGLDIHSFSENEIKLAQDKLRILSGLYGILRPLDMIQPGKYQPRVDMSQESLEELADSIRAQGLVQPIIVRPVAEGKYEIVAGERRWRASRMAGLVEVPVLVRDVSDRSAIAMALIVKSAPLRTVSVIR